MMMAKNKIRRAYSGPIYQNHHIVYGGEPVRPEWTVNLRSWMHKAVTLLNRLTVTPESYAEAINFQTAINAEVNRMRMTLDTEGDE
jgi:hypothetical protein